MNSSEATAVLGHQALALQDQKPVGEGLEVELLASGPRGHQVAQVPQLGGIIPEFFAVDFWNARKGGAAEIEGLV